MARTTSPCATAPGDGTRLPYLGGWLEIRIASGNNQARWTEGESTMLTLRLRSPDYTEAVLGNALRKRALEMFGPRLAHHAARLGIVTPPLALTSARTRWGSCSLKTGIRLNWRLIHCAPHIIDYVIVHELAHLREMNHSVRF